MTCNVPFLLSWMKIVDHWPTIFFNTTYYISFGITIYCVRDVIQPIEPFPLKTGFCPERFPYCGFCLTL